MAHTSRFPGDFLRCPKRGVRRRLLGPAAGLVLLACLASAPPPARALVPMSSVTQVAAGTNHSCALSTAGGVKCWGSNLYGQLGDDSMTERLIPVDVSGLASGVGEIKAGDFFTCALTTGGGVKCWGYNGFGQLGDDSGTTRIAPVDVTGLASGVSAIATGGNHACALTTGGGVKCWGENTFGQLGDNSTTHRFTPVDVSGLASGVIAITAGDYHSCALTTAGGVKCWGYNNNGQLGDSTTTNRPTPVDVTGLASGVDAISAGAYFTCALTTAGGVKCWGSNTGGQLGDNTTEYRFAPVDVTGLASGVGAIAGGSGHTCAITTAGAAKCWGSNGDGQLGDSTTTNRLVPADVTGLASGAVSLAAGGSHTCAVTAAGGAKCWGHNTNGQLGDNSTNRRIAAVDVAGLAGGASMIAAGGHHSCVLTAAGGVKCWGNNSSGQLGDNSTAYRYAPGDVTGLASGVAAIAAGGAHTCALTTAGGVKCWGNNGNGQLGDNTTTNRLVPVNVSGLASGVTAIAADGSHTCALTSAGGVKCWGGNGFGQLGDNTTTQRLVPTDVSGLSSGASAIAAGGAHTCAITTAGGVKCWGYNGFGGLGDNTTTNRPAPVDVTGLASGVAAIAAGDYHSCALTTAGGVKCWGYNFAGQVGDNSTTQRLVPADVVGLSSGVGAIVTGAYFSCARTTAGGLKCWGANEVGQVGNNATTNQHTAVDVAGLSSGVDAIATGSHHACALPTAGGMKCWGNNAFGQLGDGTGGTRPFPGDVLDREPQSISFASLPDRVFGSAPFTVSATASSGLAVSFGSLTGSVCTVADTTVTLAATGTCTIAADQPGDAFYLPAPQVTRSFEACANGAPVANAGGPYTATIGNGVNLDASASNDPDAACGDSIVSYEWDFSDDGAYDLVVALPTELASPGLAPGAYTVRVRVTDSAGATGTATAALTIDKAATTTGIAGAAGSVRFSTATFTATVAGFSPTGTVTFKDGASAIGSCTAVPLSGGQAQCGLSTLAAGPHTITAEYSGDANNLASGSTGLAHTVVKAPQAITLDPIADRVLADGPFAVSPTAGSGLAVTLSTLTTTACSVAGFTITPLADGACTIDADQAGDADYAAATRVSRTFNVLGDTTPSAFSFTPAADVSPGALVTSASVAVGGINAPSAISVANGSYSIGCNGGFTAAAGSITNGQSVCVRHQASGDYATGVTTTLTIGGVSADFVSTTLAQPVSPPTRGDANGDRKADLFWADGPAISWWLMDGAAITNSTYYEAPAGWAIADVGDLDGDGRADLVWRRASDGATYAWLVSATGFSGFVDLGVVPTSFALVGLADLDGDGDADLVWRSAAGQVYGWLMAGGTIAAQGVIANPGATWQVIDLADMDGDGRADIVYRHATTGEVWVMAMNGLAISSQGSAGTLDPSAWNLNAAADFDGDGKADLLWRSTAGETWVWKMDGTAFVAAGSLGNPGAGWSVRALGDLDGDGKVDLVWRHTDGTAYLWRMNGLTVTAFEPVANPGGAWQLVAP
jgi:alpha-tubulin suppressor-like RCC1 family protein